ncbi:uncharacterized protein BCR38DRAFT_47144 [Pseudomassariella vexata]|uniref:Uncharacterized protein n=1 Tax=Pseudomassariella vexata TaxID=1141098 RepID=A0A1Y2DNM5_9PEZI|nr:uncharacterized protein BCR38DRAFT_47144 [Pseudomassariella vexata]ORY60807.1 hypothetical protein BCR38DRAFT_47144 [Pseudomassariella vexata]
MTCARGEPCRPLIVGTTTPAPRASVNILSHGTWLQVSDIHQSLYCCRMSRIPDRGSSTGDHGQGTTNQTLYPDFDYPHLPSSQCIPILFLATPTFFPLILLLLCAEFQNSKTTSKPNYWTSPRKSSRRVQAFLSRYELQKASVEFRSLDYCSRRGIAVAHIFSSSTLLYMAHCPFSRL